MYNIHVHVHVLRSKSIGTSIMNTVYTVYRHTHVPERNGGIA